MTKDVLNYVTAKTLELMDSPTCCADAKEAARMWLNALGTDNEAEMTKNYLAELEEDIVTIDGLIAFTGSEAGVSCFGAEKAADIKAHAEEIRESGAKYCDCPACSLVAEILEKKEEMLG